MAQQNLFRLIGGAHQVGETVFTKGDLVKSAKDLRVQFPNKFELVQQALDPTPVRDLDAMVETHKTAVTSKPKQVKEQKPMRAAILDEDETEEEDDILTSEAVNGDSDDDEEEEASDDDTEEDESDSAEEEEEEEEEKPARRGRPRKKKK